MESSRTVASQGVSVASIFLRQVYQWMTIGLLVTAALSWVISNNESAMRFLFSNMYIPIMLFVAQIGLVIALSAAVHKMSASTATGLFLLYASLTGVTFSALFIVYPIGSIFNAFVTAAGTFLAMSVYGMTTKRDLTSLGSFCAMGLIGVIIASIVNIFMQSSMMDFVISVIGVIVFTGLTAYDTQKLKVMGESAPLSDATAIRRGVIIGAFTLYLDFINLFLMMLRLFGGNRD